VALGGQNIKKSGGPYRSQPLPDKERLEELINRLEMIGPTDTLAPGVFDGNWSFAYSDELTVFRVSPFYWSFAEAVKEAAKPIMAVKGSYTHVKIANVRQTWRNTSKGGFGSYVLGTQVQVKYIMPEARLENVPWGDTSVRVVINQYADVRPHPSDPARIILELKETKVEEIPEEDWAPRLPTDGTYAFATRKPVVEVPIESIIGVDGKIENRPDYGNTTVEFETTYFSPAMHILRNTKGEVLVYFPARKPGENTMGTVEFIYGYDMPR
jgi:hypothetical protein